MCCEYPQIVGLIPPEFVSINIIAGKPEGVPVGTQVSRPYIGVLSQACGELTCLAWFSFLVEGREIEIVKSYAFKVLMGQERIFLPVRAKKNAVFNCDRRNIIRSTGDGRHQSDLP